MRGKERGAGINARPVLRPNASLPSNSTIKFNDLFTNRGKG